jgi:hypothetical protein
MLFKEFIINNTFSVALILFFFTTVNFYIYLRLFLKTLTKKENRNFLVIKNSSLIKTSVLFGRFYGLALLAVFCLA